MQNSKGLSNAHMSNRLRARLRVRADVGLGSDFLSASTLENIYIEGWVWLGYLEFAESEVQKKFLFFLIFFS